MTIKTFYSTIPFCNLQIMRGPGYCEAVSIVGGRIDTDDPAVIEYLEGVCDKPGSIITSRGREQVAADVLAAQADARAAAETAHAKMVAAGLPTA